MVGEHRILLRRKLGETVLVMAVVLTVGNLAPASFLAIILR
jgi:hypothetical protein